MSRVDDRALAGQHHIDRLTTAHQLVREAILRAEEAGLDPTVAAVPRGKSLDDEGASPSPLHLKAHTAVLDYQSQVAMFAGELPSELWEETVYTCDIPQSDGRTVDEFYQNRNQKMMSGYQNFMRQKHAHVFDPPDDDPPATEPVGVTLDSLPNWRTIHVSYVVAPEGSGKTSFPKEYRKRILLPIAAIAAAFTQLNLCLSKLGIRAEIESLPSTDEPPEPPEHVREEAPAFAGDAPAPLENGRGK